MYYIWLYLFNRRSCSFQFTTVDLRVTVRTDMLAMNPSLFNWNLVVTQYIFLHRRTLFGEVAF